MFTMLSQESARLSRAVSSIPLPLEAWVVGRDGHIDDPPHEPALAEAMVALAREVTASGTTQSRELSLAPPAGLEAVRLFARPSASGDVAVAVLRIDALSEVESTLTRYDLVLRATRDAVWEWNVTTQEAWWNGRQYEMLSYDPKTTRPSYEAWVNRVHPEDRARVVANFDAAVAGGATTWQDEFRFLRGDGSVGTTLDRGYIERDQQGRPMRMIGVMSDVTEERAAAIALAGSEERFRQLASAIDEVFWMTNAAGNEIIYVSPAYESIWGRTCQSLYEAPESFLDPIHEEDRPRIEARLPAQRAGGYDEVYRIRRPNGELAWIRDRAFPIHDEAGNLVRIAGVATDITAQRNLEEQLLQARKLESIGRLAGGVAHDFNNLLTVILSSAEFAMRDLPSGTARNDLEQVKDAAERAARLTAQLLAFARRQVVAPCLLDLNEVAQGMHGLLRRVIGEHVELSIVLGGGLHQVLADPGQIEQVLVNLAVNARDAMPEGGRLTLETANVCIDRAYATSHANVDVGEYVMLAVSDTGTGIPPEVLKHIFEPFFTTKVPGRGTGLGLATCYGTIRQAGGQILVYSELGNGTTFKILLPRALEGARPGEVGSPHPRDLRGSETVLVVEDDSVLRGVAARMLRQQGYAVLEASSGPEALQLARAHVEPVQLLLTDVVMPQMSGLELARRLLALFSEARVLFTSGYTENAIVHQGVLEPNVAFLPKPYVAATLLAKVRAVLDAI